MKVKSIGESEKAIRIKGYSIKKATDVYTSVVFFILYNYLFCK